MRRLHWLLLFASLVFASLALLTFHAARAQSAAPLVLVLKADIAVGPVMQGYIQRGVTTAEKRQAEVLVIELNTPGGAIVSVNEIDRIIRASHVPVIVYVTPRGGMAASAGTLITLAAHASAMAPETTIGAASPVGSDGQDLPTTEQTKQENDLKASARTYASRRSAQAIQMAEASIDNAAAFSAEEAKSAGLVDFIAIDLDDLLKQLDGYTVQMPKTEGAETVYTPRTLHTAHAVTEDLLMTFIEQLLAVLVDPNIVFLLTAIGIPAILIELSNPGGWIPGFIGVVCLALAAYGLGVLPVNWFGVVFLILAFTLFILDVHAPTHGLLTAAGIGSFIIGALVLFNSPGTPQFQQVSPPLVIITGLAIGVGFATLLAFGLRAQKAPLRMGPETLVGQQGAAQGELDPRGQVRVHGELWSAELAEGVEPVRSGEIIEVVRVEGLRLRVRKLKA